MLNVIQNKLNHLSSLIDVQNIKKRISEIDELISFNPNFWQNPNHELLKERAHLDKLSNEFISLSNEFNDLSEYLDVFPSEINEYQLQINDIEKKVTNLELQQMFKDPLDNAPAMLTISAGAGRSRSC